MEQLFRSPLRAWFMKVAIFGLGRIEDSAAATPTLGSLFMIAGVGQEMPQRGQQKRSKLALAAVGIVQIIFFKKPGEKRLRQILAS